jgi:hypothetical protein
MRLYLQGTLQDSSLAQFTLSARNERQYYKRNCHYSNARGLVRTEKILSASARSAIKPDVSTSVLSYRIRYGELPGKYGLQIPGGRRLRGGTAQATGAALCAKNAYKRKFNNSKICVYWHTIPLAVPSTKNTD